ARRPLDQAGDRDRVVEGAPGRRRAQSAREGRYVRGDPSPSRGGLREGSRAGEEPEAVAKTVEGGQASAGEDGQRCGIPRRDRAAGAERREEANRGPTIGVGAESGSNPSRQREVGAT